MILSIKQKNPKKSKELRGQNDFVGKILP